ncbi:MAG: DUF2721 domain-containing protein [Pseudomonadota bacterium]
MGETIQLAMAPVFLLVAIGALLQVVTNRLGRIIDRARILELRIENGAPQRDTIIAELRELDQRMRFNHWSINFLSIAALIVATLVAALFLGLLTSEARPTHTSVLFIVAMLSIILGISCFIAEVYVATRTVRVKFDRF